jgi:cytochrome P450
VIIYFFKQNAKVDSFCISFQGMRFALIEAKVAVAYLVHYFKIEPTAKTPIPVKTDSGMNRPVSDLELKFTLRSKH